MTDELKKIKKKYGEKMAHLCRMVFPSILETDGLLLDLMLKHFYPTHDLYDDIVNNNLVNGFKSFIYNLIDNKEKKKDSDKTPRELLKEAGYILFECHTEEDINYFKKYYQKNELLCTFNGGRLNSCYVFFAVKKDADKIKRSDYKNPLRQDKYGTSVISIQFTKDESHTLSIKNRYNHTVNNPDATYSNNLDNIISGLTKAFEKTYGMKQKYCHSDLEIPNYVKASDGKYYKYNYEVYNTYYCPDNIIIEDFKVKKYDKEKYIVLDTFILDLVNKKISDENNDKFIETIGKIDKINITKHDNNKLIKIKPIIGENIDIILDKQNRIVSYKNNNVRHINGAFLYKNNTLTNLELNNLEITGMHFLSNNNSLTKLKLPNLKITGVEFLPLNKVLKEIELPNLKKAGVSFLRNNEEIENVWLPNLEKADIDFFSNNPNIKTIYLPKIKSIEGFAFCNVEKLKCLILPNVQNIGFHVLRFNKQLEYMYTPKLEILSNEFMIDKKIKYFYAPNLKDDFIKVKK